MAEKDWSHWGHLAERYATPRPRRMLTLDGGGIRGVLSVEVLVELEKKLRARLGKPPSFVLADYFDDIGGTSTGAIIAAALALGRSAEEVRDLYHEFGKKAFTKEGLFARWKNSYDHGPLEQKLKQEFGVQTTLRPEGLRSLLLVVTRNADTDSAWPVSSNPDAKYNEKGRDYCNLDFPLWQLVRASTAAPTYFDPEIIEMTGSKGTKRFAFVDGGTTAYNNPAFLLYKMATHPVYGLGWKSGEKDLLIVSVGTGSAPVQGVTADDPTINLLGNAITTLSTVLSQAQIDQDMSCRLVGRCVHGGMLDREVGNLIPADPGKTDQRVPLSVDLGRAFLYARYDVMLTKEGLAGLKLSHIDPKEVAKMDAIEAIPALQEIGARLAQEIDLTHYGSFV
jgi:predicted acylesterase/phospholipase RssA